MQFFAYLIPFLTCLLLKIAFKYDGEWQTYLYVFLAGEICVGILHLVFYSSRTSSNEFLGSYIIKTRHTDPWIELIERQETKRDANGNSYTVTKIEERYHKEEFHFYTNIGSTIKTNEFFFNKIINTWNVGYHLVKWTGKEIKGGERFAQDFFLNDTEIKDASDHYKFITISEINSYTNKVKNSNSIYRTEKISKKEAKSLGLFEWPIPKDYDVPAILSQIGKIPDEIDSLYRRFNSLIAPNKQMRLFLLLFRAENGIAIAEKQKSYWKGGNKNEFIICLGIDKEKNIQWVYPFSWANENIVEVETTQWFLENSCLNLKKFLIWFNLEHRKWKRREFKDFNYIKVDLQLWQTIFLFVAAILVGIISIYICIN